MSIDPFEQLWDAEFLQQEIVEFFGKFDESLWGRHETHNMLKVAFAEHLESGEPIEDFYRHLDINIHRSVWNCGANDERRKYLAMRIYAQKHNYRTAMDYGCGIGSGVITLALAGLDKVVGTEICLPNMEFLKARVDRFGLENVKIVDVYKKSTRHMVDLLICTEVLEHVEDPISFIEKLDKRVKPGGSMILSWSFVPTPTHLSQHFDSGFQHSHPDTITIEGFGKIAMIDLLGYEFQYGTWFNNTAWIKRG